MANDIQINLNKFFENPSFSGKRIGVALSGGRDSVALAYALKTADIPLIAINVEHGIRGENSLKDSKFVEDFCKKYDIPLLSFSLDVPSFCEENGYTTEQGARILRYEIFDKVLDEGKCDYIALAHHADDQAETIFMRIIRGTGVRGLCGMKEVSGRYIRPLLNCTREDINAFVEQNSLPFVEDETNSDTAYTRNFIRAELSRIKEKFPFLCTSVSRLCQNANEVCDYIDQNTPSLKLENGEVAVNVKYMDGSLEGKELVLKAAKLLGVCQDIEQRHFPLVFDLVKAQNGKRIELTHGICVHKEGENLVFSRQNGTCGDAIDTPKTKFEVRDFDDLGVSVKRSDRKEYEAQKGKGALFIDGDKVAKNAVLRYRKGGDFIEKFGGGTKSVGDFFTDKKVPLRKRDSLVLLASGNEVLAVVGLEISKKVAVDEDTKNILKLTKK